MKSLKRTVAVFVSAIMIMTMLVGCSSSSSSSVAKQLRKATGTSQSSSLDALVESIVEKGAFSTVTIQAAFSENNYEVTYYKYSNGTAYAETTSEGIASGSYVKQIIEIKCLNLSQEALLASADSAKDNIEDTEDDLEQQGYIVDKTYLAVAEFGTNQWVVATCYLVTY